MGDGTLDESLVAKTRVPAAGEWVTVRLATLAIAGKMLDYASPDAGRINFRVLLRNRGTGFWT